MDPELRLRHDGTIKVMPAATSYIGNTADSDVRVDSHTPATRWVELRYGGAWSLRSMTDSIALKVNGRVVPTRERVQVPAGPPTIIELFGIERPVRFELEVVEPAAAWSVDRPNSPDSRAIGHASGPPGSPRGDGSASDPEPVAAPQGQPAGAASGDRAGDIAIAYPLSEGNAIILGRRGGAADVVADGPELAERQVSLLLQNGRLRVRALDHGTYPFIGGVPVMQGWLAPGDQFQLGRSAYKFDPRGVLIEVGRVARRGSTVLSLTNVTFTRKARKGEERKSTLNSISFDVAAGEFLAVIGPSGMGKSTLCFGLVGEIKLTGGSMRLGDVDLAVSAGRASHLFSFVPQHTEFFPELTVGETMEFAARLRLASDQRKTDRYRLITEALRQVRLDDDRHKRTDKISGGMQKRLSIAMEILTSPILLLLDEPTSGLDEGMDRDLMNLLAKQAEGGRAIIIVTHSMVNLDRAKRLLAIAAGGKIGYLGNPTEIRAYFNVPRFAEVMDRLRSGNIPRPVPPPTLHGRPKPSHPAGTPRSPLFKHVRALTHREFIRQRNSALAQKLVSYLVYPALAGGLAVIAGSDGLQGPGARQGIMMLVVCLCFFGMAQSFTSIVNDYPILKRESRWGVSAFAQVAARFLGFLPATLWLGVGSISLLLRIRPGPEHPLVFGEFDAYLLGILVPISAMGLGLFLSAASTSLRQTVLMFIAVLAILVVMSGLAIKFDSFPPLRILSVLSPSRWAAAGFGAEAELNDHAPPSGVDEIWEHDGAHFWVSCVALVAIGAMAIIGASIRLQATLDRQQ